MSPADHRRLILFDLDGCIVDSTEPFVSCINASLEEHGLTTVRPAELVAHIGPPLQHIIATLLADQRSDPSLVDSVIAGYRMRYRTVSIERAVTYPGVVEAIEVLSMSERLAVCTSKPTRFAEPILGHLGLAERFELIAGPGLTEAESKVDTLARALDELAPFDRAASVMVGDRHHDVDAALHHGLLPVGVTWGFGSRDELASAGAVAIVDQPRELPDVLAGLGRPPSPPVR